MGSNPGYLLNFFLLYIQPPDYEIFRLLRGFINCLNFLLKMLIKSDNDHKGQINEVSIFWLLFVLIMTFKDVIHPIIICEQFLKKYCKMYLTKSGRHKKGCYWRKKKFLPGKILLMASERTCKSRSKVDAEFVWSSCS